MKARFSTLDIIAILPELRSKICTGWRVNQVYNSDYKTYIFKLNKSIVQMKKDDDPLSVDEETANKMTFIIESGLRIHTTESDWPKSHTPSAFCSKLRKNIRNKRIEDIKQIGIDRIIDITFGSSHAANHLIVELYDRGNLILTDSTYCILAILRWTKPISDAKSSQIDEHVSSNDDQNMKVGCQYSMERCKSSDDLDTMTEERIIQLLANSDIHSKTNQNYKKRNKNKQPEDGSVQEINVKNLLNPYVIYGGSLLEDRLLKNLAPDKKSAQKCVIYITKDKNGGLDQDQVRKYAKLIKNALDDAEAVLLDVINRKQSPGYVVQKKQKVDISRKISSSESKVSGEEYVITNIDFFPILSCAERKIQQDPGQLILQDYDSFDRAVDVYYCNLESQKINSGTINAEKEARKKLENLKISQDKRLEALSKAQEEDEEKARLIEINNEKVENALLIIRSMIANQVSWSDIWTTIKDAQAMEDPIASLITNVRFDRNEFTMKLSDPYAAASGEENSSFKNVDIDISLSAYANARRFFVKRRHAVNKKNKTLEVSKKAYKNVEKSTKEMLKEVVVKTNITKARKRYWFENFFWFISSDGYLVVAGRDAEQNDLLVKRYMKNNDIYVHADLHGASSVIIKNESSSPVSPKTLTEAGTMAVCYSSAWDSKIATTSWWVYPSQVSKSAPSGEYLSVGAFIIRGKKNYLPLSNLVLGFGFLFRLGEESIERRKKANIAKEANLCLSQADKSENSNAKSVADTDTKEFSEEDRYEEHCESMNDRKTGIAAINNEPSEANDNNVDADDDSHNIDDEEISTHELKLFDTLSEFPLVDDELLYGIPVCGPYSAFQTFKYKVKVIPGNSKRGKAAKACLGMFLHDRRASQREKDLLKALKDQDYARNIPNNVKISGPSSKTVTKKRPKKSEVRLPM